MKLLAKLCKKTPSAAYGKRHIAFYLKNLFYVIPVSGNHSYPPACHVLGFAQGIQFKGDVPCSFNRQNAVVVIVEDEAVRIVVAQ